MTLEDLGEAMAMTRAQQAIEAALGDRRDALDLHGLGLEALPPLGADLIHLRRLDLSGNRLQALPDDLWALAALEHLDLGANRLRALDPRIGQLVGLTSLDVSQNRLSALPGELAACTSLRTLDLFGNLIAEWPSVVGELGGLVALDLSGNVLTALPDMLGRLSRLELLDVSANRLAALGSGWDALTALRILKLGRNRLVSIDELAPLASLEELLVDDNAIVDVTATVQRLPSLRVLSARRNPVIGGDVALASLRPGRTRHAAPDGRGVSRPLAELVSGGYEPGTRYSNAPTYGFRFALQLTDAPGIAESIDIYFKEFTGVPATLALPGDAEIDLRTLDRKSARTYAAAERHTPSDGATIRFAPTSDADQVASVCEFAERVSERVAGVSVTASDASRPRPAGARAIPRARGESTGDLESLQPPKEPEAVVLPTRLHALTRAVEAAAPAGERAEPVAPVDAAVYCPPRVARGSDFLVQVFLYTPGMEQAVEEVAAQVDATAGKRGSYSIPIDVPLGTRVDVRLEIPHLSVSEPDAILTWRGRPVSAQFEVTVPPDLALPQVIARVRFAVAGVPAGIFRCTLTIAAAGSAADQARPMELEGTRYRRAFVSYSSKDRAEVLRRVQAFRIAGMSVFQDILDLDPGDRWDRELYREIDACDVFLLFWSRAAAASEWVAREIAYALARKAGDEERPPHIQPVPIEGPPVVPPPAPLATLHFNDALLAQIRAATD